MSLQNNTTELQDILDAVNDLPVSESDISFGKNLSDPNEMTANKYIHNTSGNEVSYIGWAITGWIPIEHGKTYSVAPNGILSQLQYSAFYDGNKQYIRSVKLTDFITNKMLFLTPPENARFMRFSAVTADIAAAEVYHVITDYTEEQEREPILQDKTVIPSDQRQEVTADDGYDGLGTVTVEAESEPILQNKTVTPSASEQTVTADAGYDGLGIVTVEAESEPALQNKIVTPSNQQQIITADEGYDGLNTVTVEAERTIVLQNKTVTPTTSDQLIEADAGKVGLASVTVKGVTAAIDSDIVPGNIKSGVNILGVTGTLEAGGGGSNEWETIYRKHLELGESYTPAVFPSGLTKIKGYAFYLSKIGAASIPEGVTEIGDNAFQACYSMESVTLPSTLTKIGTYAFAAGYKLKSIVIPDSVTSIGDGALSGCGLESVTLSNSITVFPYRLLYNSGSLTNITIPASVITIANQALGLCPKLIMVRFKGTPTSISSTAFLDTTQTNLHIYVPWAQGEVANAPWGATGATIHYNSTEA